jgi:hypothetical protein
MPTLTISIPEDVKKILTKRAKKNMLSLKEQAEEILRQSAIRTKAGLSSSNCASDDKLVEIFSRKKRKK